jgi:archaellum biogenesis protein FlaJ (TadC family)
MRILAAQLLTQFLASMLYSTASGEAEQEFFSAEADDRFGR